MAREIAPVRPEDLDKLKFNHRVITLPYVNDRFSHTRRKTREVKVGDLGIGGNNPLRVQSMTISDTQDVKSTVNEAEVLANAGCELVRITAPSQKDAECLKEIRAELNRRGCRVPLCADIHFTPQAAMLACEYVEKVRVNPGNFADKKVFAVREYSDNEYGSELERIEEKFRPLVRRAKELGRALRVGTNHGSLSDRIMNRYGDTPHGMVESAMEFIEICRSHDFHDIIVSMKASNPKVMIQAYRLLCARFDELGYDYPLHLGVTEAGAGEDGRLKSAVGIGSLLEDGIGDTVRVSLTEDSIHEVPVCYELVRRFTPHPADPKRDDFKAPVKALAGPLPEARTVKDIKAEVSLNPYEYVRRATALTTLAGVKFGGEEPPRVQIALAGIPQGDRLDEVKGVLGLDASFMGATDAAALPGNPRAEIIEVPLPASIAEINLKPLRKFLAGMRPLDFPVALALRLPRFDKAYWSVAEAGDDLVLEAPRDDEEEPWANSLAEFLREGAPGQVGLQWIIGEKLPAWVAAKWGSGPEAYAQFLFALVQVSRDLGYQVLPGFELANPVAAYRFFAELLHQEKLSLPIMLREPLRCPLTPDDLRSASVMGGLLCDGIGDLVAIEARERTPYGRVRLAYNFLQATGSRVTKTEFISCPSCGRTLFNLQETTERIRSKMGHLKGLKLAIMGCIVNGPGEMADAHFGYVGAGPGKINLYVGKDLVKKNIPQEEADDRLIDLIKEHGLWLER